MDIETWILNDLYGLGNPAVMIVYHLYVDLKHDADAYFEWAVKYSEEHLEERVSIQIASTDRYAQLSGVIKALMAIHKELCNGNPD